MKILIIAGGQSTEHDVSRMSATNILNNISPPYEVTTLGINKDGKWYELDKSINDLRNDNWLDNSKEIHNNIEYLQKFDCVFPVLHGSYGEDGTIQGLFELANVP